MEAVLSMDSHGDRQVQRRRSWRLGGIVASFAAAAGGLALVLVGPFGGLASAATTTLGTYYPVDQVDLSVALNGNAYYHEFDLTWSCSGVDGVVTFTGTGH